MSDDSTPKDTAPLEGLLSSNNKNQNDRKTAEGADLPNCQTHSDDDDDDDDEDDDDAEHLEDGPPHCSIEANKPSVGTSLQDKDRGSLKPKVVKKRKKRKMKPKDYPKRPLSAYNIFFKQTREKNLKENGKLSFQDMVKTVATQWKDITPEEKEKYEQLAKEDLARYKKAVGVYERETLEKNRLERLDASKARKKAVAEEKLQAKQAKKDATSHGIAYPPSGPSDIGADRGGWDERTFPPGNPYLAKSMRMSVNDNSFPPQSVGLNPASHLDGVAGIGLGSTDLTAARNRIQGELRSLEETRAIQLRCLELAQAAGISPAAAVAALQSSGRAGLLGGLDQRTPTELDRLQQQVVAANEADIRERLAAMRHPDIAAEHESRLLEEARLAALGHSGFSSGGAASNPYSSLLAPLITANPYEEALMREQLLRRQELLLRAGIGGTGGAGPFAGYSGSALHSALGGGLGTGLGALGGAQPFTDLISGGSAGGGLGSLGAIYGQHSRLGMGMVEDRLANLGRLSGEDLLRAVSRQVPGNNLSHPSSVGEARNSRIDPPE